MFDVQFTPAGQKDLKKLSKEIRRRMLKKIDFFASQSNPTLFARPLVNLPPATHRFRVGDYRIAFFMATKTIYIDRIRHRREVYLH